MKPVQPSRFATRRIVRATLLATALVGAAATAVTASVSDARPAASATDSSAGPPSVFVNVSPTRVLDTRGPAAGGPIGVLTAGKIGPDSELTLPLAGDGLAIPATANAALLNITIDGDASAPSFLTVWPANEPRPFTSANNALPGLIASNSMLAKLGNGAIKIYNQQGEVNVVIDLVGYTVPLSSVASNGGGILAGDTAPADSLGSDGDFYIDVVNHILYGPKKNGHWPAGIPLGGATGPAGPAGAAGAAGSQISTGSGVPNPSVGTTGDLYVDISTGTLYVKGASGWISKGSIQGPAGTNGTNGTNGADGSKILTGGGVPNPTVGAVGDIYINTTNGDLYTKSSSGWTTTTSIKGAAGNNGTNGTKIQSGNGAPTTVPVGAVGDLYVDTSNGDLYVSNGTAWVTNGSIRGAKGDKGDTGTAGTNGAVNGTFGYNGQRVANAPIDILNNTLQTVAVFTAPAAGNYLIQGNVGMTFQTGALLGVGAGATTKCRWSNNTGLTFGASISAGLTIATITVPGLDTNNIGIPGSFVAATAGATVNLQCQVTSLIALFSPVTLNAAVSSTQVATLGASS